MRKRNWLKNFATGVFLVVSIGKMPAEPGSSIPAATFQSDDTPATLLELFTSEGCSSCPAAEKWLSHFKTNPDLWKRIIPIAFHVDYWDQLGWPDRFARPEFTERQRHYAATWGGESVYTPGFVANGKEWRGWFTGTALPIRTGKAGILRVMTNGDRGLTATFMSGNQPAQSPVIEAALLGINLESDVKRGENSGRKLHHDFVVLQLAKSAMKLQDERWTASLSFSAKEGIDKPEALAVWVVSTGDTTPIQATGGWLKP